MQFVDKCIIEFKAGDGGDGIIAWRRESHYPEGGPWGGDGGRGGDIILVSSFNESSLFNLRNAKKILAPNGQNGKSKLCHGASGEDIKISIPVGSVIKDLDKDEIIYDFIKSGEEFKICKGGKGGYGNAYFKSSRNKAPKLFEKGDKGQSRKILIEIKYIADIGMLGLPNAGKSTFVSNLSSARPKIAPYKFTTLVPVLGTVNIKNRIFVFADIPGLIKDASTGHGLGHEFLKHIERCDVLIHLISLSEIDNQHEGLDIIEAYKIIREEIENYNDELLNKKIFLVANKIDSDGAKANLIKLQEYLKNQEIFVISAINKDFSNLLEKISQYYLENDPKVKIVEEDEIKIIKEEKEEVDQIKFEKNETGRWVVSSNKIDYWFNKIPQINDENTIRYHQKIELDKIEELLKKHGALAGDIMIINDVEYILD
ncbi:MAG: GTPase ObgE [Mycoplasmoidaceae bacterium]